MKQKQKVLVCVRRFCFVSEDSGLYPVYESEGSGLYPVYLVYEKIITKCTEIVV